MQILDLLHPIDLGVFFILLASFFILPKLGPSPSTKNHEYLAMGRALSLPLFVATLTSTWYGAILGVTQIAFLKGFYGFITQGLCWYAAYVIFALFLAKKIRQKNVLTIPELIGERFGSKARHFTAILLFFHALPITYAISMAIFLKLVFGISFHLSLIVLVACISWYTGRYGLRGIVISDAMQCIVMYASVISLTVVCYFGMGDLAFLQASLPASYFSLTGQGQINQILTWFFLACMSTFIHPVFYQRCLSANSDKTAQWGIGISMLLWFIFDICTCLGGMYAKALLPAADSSTAYISLAMKVLPNGLKGLFLAGILATIISTLDSFLLVASSSISYDIFPNHKKHGHLIASLFAGLVIIAIGLVFKEDFESLWLFVEGLFSSCLLLPIFTSLLTKINFTPKEFFLITINALLTFILVSFLFHWQLTNIQPIFAACGVALLLSFTTLVLQKYQRSGFYQ